MPSIDKEPKLWSEIAVRLVLFIIFYYTEDAVPYYRKIQPEEYWLYNFPRTNSYYPGTLLWITISCVPTIVILFFLFTTASKIDAKQAALGASLSILLAGSVTNCIKLAVGRPRPDFLARCFPDGSINDKMECIGKEEDVIQGYKSFPSGHSSFSFSSLGFTALYIAGKLHCFNRRGRGNSVNLCVVVMVLLWATLIAASRTADFHHHWQDVTVGSILGFVIAYTSYRQYYPPLTKCESHLPYIAISDSTDSSIDHNSPLLPLVSTSDTKNSMLKFV